MDLWLARCAVVLKPACTPEANVRLFQWRRKLYSYSKVEELFEAVLAADAKRVGSILEHGLSANKRNLERKRTAIMVAAMKGYRNCVSVLLRKGANPNLRDNEGFNALFYAMRRPSNQRIIRDLIKGGAHVNARNPTGRTPLMEFADDRYFENIKELIRHGPDLNRRDVEGDTALTNAAIWGSKKVAALLLKAGADPHLPDGVGARSITLARIHDHKAIVRLLESTEKSQRRERVKGARKKGPEKGS